MTSDWYKNGPNHMSFLNKECFKCQAHIVKSCREKYDRNFWYDRHKDGLTDRHIRVNRVTPSPSNQGYDKSTCYICWLIPIDIFNVVWNRNLMIWDTQICLELYSKDCGNSIQSMYFSFIHMKSFPFNSTRSSKSWTKK